MIIGNQSNFQILQSKELVAYILEQSKHFMTNNIVLTMGEDFHYQYAHAWYKNLDKLIS